MYKKPILLTLIAVAIIVFVMFATKQKESYFVINKLYSPSNDASVWKSNPYGTIELAHEDKYYTVRPVTPIAPSPPECRCPKCPEAICPTCPNEEDILRKHGYLAPVQYEHRAPIKYRSTHYQLVGYLHKLRDAMPGDKNHVQMSRKGYEILPLYGKEHRGNFFKYYTQFVSDAQAFRKMVFKPPATPESDYSREIYEGDEIMIDAPINAIYRFKEERLSNRIDLFDEDPHV